MAKEPTGKYSRQRSIKDISNGNKKDNNDDDMEAYHDDPEQQPAAPLQPRIPRQKTQEQSLPPQQPERRLRDEERERSLAFEKWELNVDVEPVPVPLDVLFESFADEIMYEEDEDATSRTSSTSTCDAVAILPESMNPGGKKRRTKPKKNRSEKIPMYLREKKGGICCCICDFRRAVIFCSSICLVLGGLLMVLFIGSSTAVNQGAIDDDGLLGALTLEDNRSLSIFFGIEIIAAGLGIAGAVHFNVLPVLFHALWLISSWTSMVVLLTLEVQDLRDENLVVDYPLGQFIVFGVIVIFLVYPHFRFIIEVRTGIMSHRTYPREAHGCCCMKKGSEFEWRHSSGKRHLSRRRELRRVAIVEDEPYSPDWGTVDFAEVA